MPVLQVKRADFQYDLQVLDVLDAPAAETAGTQVEPSLPPRWRARWVPLAEPATEIDGLRANIRVNILVEQADMPAGIASLLNLTNGSVAAAPVGGGLLVTPSVLDLYKRSEIEVAQLSIELESVSVINLDQTVVTSRFELVGEHTETERLVAARALAVRVIVGTEVAAWTEGTISVRPLDHGLVQLAVWVIDPQELADLTHASLDTTVSFDGREHRAITPINLFS